MSIAEPDKKPWRLILRSKPLLFIIYISDLPPTIIALAIPIIFADEASAIISSKNLDDSCLLSNRDVSLMSKWFAANRH
jgi:hypothetical protein